jgi:hypothetical protein
MDDDVIIMSRGIFRFISQFKMLTVKVLYSDKITVMNI